MGENKGFLRELFGLLKARKVWWLAPTIILLVFASALIIFGQSSAISPFIYSLF